MERKGQIGGDVEPELSELPWSFALFWHRSLLVLVRKWMTEVRVASKASRQSEEWPERPGSVVHSDR